MTPDELNNECVDRLTAADLAGRVVVVGSGPSSPYVAPIGKLQESLCARCGISKNSGERFSAFSQRAHEGNASQYFSVLKETYGDTPHWSADVYQHLANIPFKGFATFNYDDQLPKAFRNRFPATAATHFSVYPPRNGQTYFAALELLSQPPRLMALHGYCDPDNDEWEKQIILRAPDYQQHYIDHPALLFEWWRNLLLSVPCIFVGTSLEEPGLYRVMEYLLPHSRDRLSNLDHLHLIDVQLDPVSLLYPARRKSLGEIDRVYFDRLDDRYSGLLKVLSHFSRLPTDRPSPRAPAPKPITALDTIDFDSL